MLRTAAGYNPSNVAITGGTILPDSVYGKLRRGYKRHRYDNPHVNAAMTSPPTVTVTGTQPVGSTNSYPETQTQSFYYTGGDRLDVAGNRCFFPVATLLNGGGTGNAGNGRNANSWRVKVVADSIAPVFRFNGANQVRFVVQDTDGKMRYVSTAGTTLNQAGNNNFVQLDFTAVGGRSTREIWVEGEQAQMFCGAFVGPTETIRPAPTGMRMTVFGDSITTGTGATFENDGFATVFADCFGISDVRCSGIGSQGYVALGSGSTYDALARLPYDAVTSDVFVFALGTNDIGLNMTTLATKLTACVAYLRANFSASIPIIVLGCPAGQTGPSANAITCDNAITAAATAINDSNLIVIADSNNAAGSFISGTGKVGATTGTGNSDIYTSSDGTHPSTSGHLYKGLTFSDSIYSAISNR